MSVAEAAGGSPQVLKRRSQKQVLQTISALPHGVMKMSAAISGPGGDLDERGGASPRKADTVSLVTSQRSSVASEKDEIAQTVRTIFELGGATVDQGEGYPGWKPNTGSPILKKALAVYSSLYGREPEVKAIHAGLECGLIGEKYPGIDMISFGPTHDRGALARGEDLRRHRPPVLGLPGGAPEGRA